MHAWLEPATCPRRDGRSGISPAVVSKRISLLEERLGARLFQRTTRQLTLTETGEGYFKRVLEILKLVEEADEFVSQRNTGPRGSLKITAPTCFSRFHVAPHLREFVARFPQIQLDMVLTDNFVDIIRDGFDVAIRIGELPDSSLVARKLAPDTRVICAGPAYLAAAGTPKSLDDLAKHNCLSAGAQDVWRLEGPEGLRNMRVKGNIRSNSAELVREALVAGLGLGLRSIWEIGPELESGAPQGRCCRNTAARRMSRSTPSTRAATSCRPKSAPSSTFLPRSTASSPIGRGPRRRRTAATSSRPGVAPLRLAAARPRARAASARCTELPLNKTVAAGAFLK